MKKLVVAIFLIVIAFTATMMINLTHASTTSTIKVDSATQQFPSAHVGDTIQVNITISNVQNLWAWDLPNIRFDPTILNLTQINEGPFLQQAGQTVFIWASSASYAIGQGDIPDTSDTLLSVASASGSGVLATLVFQVLALGTSPLTFNGTTLLDPSQISTSTAPPVSMPCNVINATITVGPSNSNPTATPTPATNSNPTPTTGSSNSSNPTTTPTNTPTTNPSSDSPTSTAASSQAPEFPLLIVLAIGIIAATASTIVIKAKTKKLKN